MQEDERQLLIAVAKWINVHHFLPFHGPLSKPFGPNASDEAFTVHYALEEVERYTEIKRLQAEHGTV